MVWRTLALCFVCLLASCTKSTPAPPLPPAEQGRNTFVRHCAACHGVNPKADGSVGPALHGSSQALLERRLVYGDYPAGYKAKRDTRIMPLLPFLKGEIPALQAYLNTP